MYRSATLAIVVSSTSMKVGTTTAAATNQGLIAGRLRALAPVSRCSRGGSKKKYREQRNEDGGTVERTREVIVQAVPFSRFKGRRRVRKLGALFASFPRRRLPLGLAEVGKTAAGDLPAFGPLGGSL